jgi:hypothetical protein
MRLETIVKPSRHCRRRPSSDHHENSTMTESINGRGCPIPSSSCSLKHLEGRMSSALVWRRSTFSPPHCASVVTLESGRGGDQSRSPCWDRPGQRPLDHSCERMPSNNEALVVEESRASRDTFRSWLSNFCWVGTVQCANTPDQTQQWSLMIAGFIHSNHDDDDNDDDHDNGVPGHQYTLPTTTTTTTTSGDEESNEMNGPPDGSGW